MRIYTVQPNIMQPIALYDIVYPKKAKQKCSPSCCIVRIQEKRYAVRAEDTVSGSM
jgi:hypothetical protein